MQDSPDAMGADAGTREGSVLHAHSVEKRWSAMCMADGEAGRICRIGACSCLSNDAFIIMCLGRGGCAARRVSAAKRKAA